LGQHLKTSEPYEPWALPLSSVHLHTNVHINMHYKDCKGTLSLTLFLLLCAKKSKISNKKHVKLFRVLVQQKLILFNLQKQINRPYKVLTLIYQTLLGFRVSNWFWFQPLFKYAVDGKCDNTVHMA